MGVIKRIVTILALASVLLTAGCQTATTPATSLQLQKSYEEEFGTVTHIKKIIYNDSPDDGDGVVGGVIAGALIGADEGAAFEGAIIGALLGGVGENLEGKTAFELRIRKDNDGLITVLQRARGIRDLRPEDRVRILTDRTGGTIVEKIQRPPS